MKTSPFLLLMACQHSSAEPTPPIQAQSMQDDQVSAKQWIRERWNSARADHRWAPPSPIEQTAIASLVFNLIQEAQNCDTPMASKASLELKEFGFNVDSFSDGSDQFWFIYEAQNGRGHGAMAIRCGEATEVVLQAPHAIFDQWTGAIVRDLFADSKFRMAMWNTTHRYRAHPNSAKTDEHHPADVAHNADSVFHQVSLELMNLPTLRIAQIHGFSQQNDWEIILSLGNAEAQADNLAAQLTPLSSSIGLYGTTASVLGATTNVLAKSIPSTEHGRFVHIELNKALRTELKSNSTQQKILSNALKQQW